MECNKDEAIRAKTIAERKISDKDFAGAKKFALKAQTLYHGLDGISQMLTTLDVYLAAENKTKGEIDWYAILGVKSTDDDETIKKSYRKLALMLHPDKNKLVGADGAFKLLSEAWSLLSDRAKRSAYNQRIMRGFQQKPPSAASHNVNGNHSFTKRAKSKPNIRTSTTTTTTTTAARMGGPGSVAPVVRPPAPPSAPPPVVRRRSDTFWTICHRCKMHYEYLNLYLNHTLLCPNCHEPFLAKEMPPPVTLPKTAQSSAQRHQNPSNHAPSNQSNTSQFTPGRTTATTQTSGKPPSGSNSFDNSKLHRGASLKTNVQVNPTIASKAASVVQQANDRLKRERQELYGGLPSKKRKTDEDGESSVVKIPFQMSTGNNNAGIGKKPGFDTDGRYVFSSRNNAVNRSRELTPLETRTMLMQKAQKTIRIKLSELESEEKLKENKKTQNSKQSSSEKEKVGQAEVDQERLAMNVPDPDFHDFDLDRTEDSFEDNQVWAAYDDDDGMPRFYALVHKVLSRKPLKLKISWLNSKTTAEFGSSLDWLGYGFRKTCGEFRIGRHEVNKSLNSFSQKVDFRKSQRGSVLIFPKKGEVWAVYRHWSADWNENIPEEVIHKYDMVQVLEDYDEDKGVPVSVLLKFAGFRTVFHPPKDEIEVKVIPREEMFRFSHQVPKYVLTGNEANNAPKDCIELDPAATPLDLIQEVENGEEVKNMDGQIQRQ